MDPPTPGSDRVKFPLSMNGLGQILLVYFFFLLGRIKHTFRLLIWMNCFLTNITRVYFIFSVTLHMRHQMPPLGKLFVANTAQVCLPVSMYLVMYI